MQFSLDDYYAKHVERTLSGDYLVHGQLSEAHCILAPAFGLRTIDGVVTPGVSNVDLAQFIMGLDVDLPTITQPELAMALNTGIDLFEISEARQSNKRLDTTEFVEQAKVLMAEHNWQTALLVAHPNHVTWVDYVCTQLGLATVTVSGMKYVRFDSQSDQYWTRSLSAWQTEVRDRQANDNVRTISKPSEET
jgi:precorrin-4 methylase